MVTKKLNLIEKTHEFLAEYDEEFLKVGVISFQ